MNNLRWDDLIIIGLVFLVFFALIYILIVLGMAL